MTGISGGLEITSERTFVFRIEDDMDQVDTIRIPCMPGLKLPLLSLQHWAETAKNNYPIKYGVKIKAYKDGCTLMWRNEAKTGLS